MVDGRWLIVLWWFSVSPCPFYGYCLPIQNFKFKFLPSDLLFRFPSFSTRRIFIKPTLVKPRPILSQCLPPTSIPFHRILFITNRIQMPLPLRCQLPFHGSRAATRCQHSKSSNQLSKISMNPATVSELHIHNQLVSSLK